MTTTPVNPLLATQDLQSFDAIRPEHIGPAITELIEETRKAVDRAADPALSPSWDDVIEPLDDVAERLSRA